MKFNNYPELINHHGDHVKIDWAIEEKTGIPKKSSDKNVLLAYTDKTEDNLEHIIKVKLVDLIHPVGSVIMTTDSSFDPADQFGGTWESWTDGYLKASDPNDAQLKNNNGTTKIAAQGEYTITKDMLPEHTHNISHTHKYTPSVQKTTDLTGSFTILGTDIVTVDEGSSNARVILATTDKFTREHVTDGTVDDYGNSITISSDDSEPSSGYYPDKVSLDVNHTHTGVPGEITSPPDLDSGNGGFSNSEYKPKYYAVIAWQRTA